MFITVEGSNGTKGYMAYSWRTYLGLGLKNDNSSGRLE